MMPHVPGDNRGTDSYSRALHAARPLWGPSRVSRALNAGGQKIAGAAGMQTPAREQESPVSARHGRLDAQSPRTAGVARARQERAWFDASMYVAMQLAAHAKNIYISYSYDTGSDGQRFPFDREIEPGDRPLRAHRLR